MRIQKAIKDKRREILRITANHGAENVRVFGSAARGDAGPNSDLDILIKLAPGRTLLDIIAIKQDLQDLLGCDVDVVTEASISPHIKEQVLKEAASL